MNIRPGIVYWRLETMGEGAFVSFPLVYCLAHSLQHSK